MKQLCKIIFHKIEDHFLGFHMHTNPIYGHRPHLRLENRINVKLYNIPSINYFMQFFVDETLCKSKLSSPTDNTPLVSTLVNT